MFADCEFQGVTSVTWTMLVQLPRSDSPASKKYLNNSRYREWELRELHGRLLTEKERAANAKKRNSEGIIIRYLRLMRILTSE